MIGIAILQPVDFNLGQIVVTRSVADIVRAAPELTAKLRAQVMAHARGQAGDPQQHPQPHPQPLDAEDLAQNKRELEHARTHDWAEGRFMSVWNLGGQVVWIITNWAGDQTVTTCSLPEEY